MLTLLTGKNDFEIRRALDAMVQGFDGEVTKVYGEDLAKQDLPDLLAGMTLFATSRLVVIRTLSENKPLWVDFADWLGRISDETHVILVEPSPDKRTKTYKDLVKAAVVHEFKEWGERENYTAQKWLETEAGRAGLPMTPADAKFLVDWVGVNQPLLAGALDKLVVLGQADAKAIRQYVEPNPAENVFDLLDAALRGNTAKLGEMLAILRKTQDPYMTFGLLTSQVLQLAMLAQPGHTAAQVAKALGAHPYALGKLEPHARRLGPKAVAQVVQQFTKADDRMKSSAQDPWILIESLLAEVSLIIGQSK